MPSSFKKNERLNSFKEIQSLMKNGESFFHYPFKVVYEKVTLQNQVERLNAIIVSVPKRNFKRAVKRNLLKRRIRESYRLNKGILTAPQGCCINVLFVYVAKEVKEYHYIEQRLKEAMELINQGRTKVARNDGTEKNS